LDFSISSWEKKLGISKQKLNVQVYHDYNNDELERHTSPKLKES
jgi:hypothetical protein